ncbi:MAG: beta-lactamase family protein [Caldilineaceae bacterium]|nr:beta-lactamase family protein [Caldilineaceae bacterium]
MTLRNEHLQQTNLSASRLDRVYHHLAKAVESGHIPGAAIQVMAQGQILPPRAFGEMRSGQATQPNTIFLTASVTKPMTVTAAMILVEWGTLLLDDPVCRFIPEFGNRGKEAVTVRHLMTHTSGLPDMLPNNIELRQAHAPLAEFYRQMFELDLDFAPGTHLQYQSCGTAMLAVIVERLSGMSLPDFLHTELFVPLGMKDTALGVRDLPQERIAHVHVGDDMRGADWGWNTPYWWNLGVPWGGMFSTVSDMARCCQMFLNGGELEGVRILSPATVAAMTRDQTSAMPLLPPEERHRQAWGLGWRQMPTLAWAYGGNLLSPGSYGHGGATGTVVWVDPVHQVVCTLFTNEPAVHSERLLGQVSNLVMAAVE